VNPEEIIGEQIIPKVAGGASPEEEHLMRPIVCSVESYFNPVSD